MTVITKIFFSHPDMALSHTIETLDSVDIRILPEVGTDPEHNMYFILIEGSVPETFHEILEQDHTVDVAEPVSEYDDQQVYGIVFAAEAKLLAPAVTRAGGISLEATCSNEGWVERWQLPNREALTTVWEVAREESFRFDVLELYHVDDNRFDDGFGLTPEQRETLVMAYLNGYFSEPRDISLVELAAELDVSPAAASGRLRRGLETLVGVTLIDYDDEDTD